MTTPLYIEIALHYYCSSTDFPRLGAPAVDEAIANFVSAGLLRDTAKPDGFVFIPGAIDEATADKLKAAWQDVYRPAPAILESSTRRFEPTQGLKVWFDALRSVPWPEQKWVLP